MQKSRLECIPSAIGKSETIHSPSGHVGTNGGRSRRVRVVLPHDVHTALVAAVSAVGESRGVVGNGEATVGKSTAEVVPGSRVLVVNRASSRGAGGRSGHRSVRGDGDAIGNGSQGKPVEGNLAASVGVDSVKAASSGARQGNRELPRVVGRGADAGEALNKEFEVVGARVDCVRVASCAVRGGEQARASGNDTGLFVRRARRETGRTRRHVGQQIACRSTSIATAKRQRKRKRKTHRVQAVAEGRNDKVGAGEGSGASGEHAGEGCRKEKRGRTLHCRFWFLLNCLWKTIEGKFQVVFECGDEFVTLPGSPCFYTRRRKKGIEGPDGLLGG